MCKLNGVGMATKVEVVGISLILSVNSASYRVKRTDVMLVNLGLGVSLSLSQMYTLSLSNAHSLSVILSLSVKL